MERILKLKELAENIQAAKLGKRGKENHCNSYNVIDEYQEWITESVDLFEKYFDIKDTNFKQFTSLPREGNGYVLIDYFDQQYPIFKLLINKIESGDIMAKSIAKSTHTESELIFISHATKDTEIINAFVDIILLGGLSVSIDKIFCVSTDGTKIKSGADWRDSIKVSLLSAKINFLIITPNYKESEVCLNEMGAAWVTSATVLPLIVDPINYKTVGVIQETNQIEKLLDERSLDRIKDEVQEKLKIPPTLIRSDRWTTKKSEFINRVKKHLETTPFEVPIDKDAFIELLQEKADLINNINILKKEKSELENLVKDFKEKVKNDKIHLSKYKPKESDKKIIKKLIDDLDINSIYENIVKQDSWNGYLKNEIIRLIHFSNEVELPSNKTSDFKLNKLLIELKIAIDNFKKYSAVKLFPDGDFYSPLKDSDENRDKTRLAQPIMNEQTDIIYKHMIKLIDYLKKMNYFE